MTAWVASRARRPGVELRPSIIRPNRESSWANAGSTVRSRKRA